MTKLTEVLLKSRLKRWDNHMDLDLYRQLLPAKLRNTVSTEGGSKKVFGCIQEMTQMMACMKRNEFNEVHCSKEVAAFNTCMLSVEAKEQKREDELERGLLVQSRGRYPPKQLNNLLQKFPQPKSK